MADEKKNIPSGNGIAQTSVFVTAEGRVMVNGSKPGEMLDSPQGKAAPTGNKRTSAEQTEFASKLQDVVQARLQLALKAASDAKDFTPGKTMMVGTGYGKSNDANQKENGAYVILLAQTVEDGKPVTKPISELTGIRDTDALLKSVDAMVEKALGEAGVGEKGKAAWRDAAAKNPIKAFDPPQKDKAPSMKMSMLHVDDGDIGNFSPMGPGGSGGARGIG